MPPSNSTTVPPVSPVVGTPPFQLAALLHRPPLAGPCQTWVAGHSRSSNASSCNRVAMRHLLSGFSRPRAWLARTRRAAGLGWILPVPEGLQVAARVDAERVHERAGGGKERSAGRRDHVRPD